MSLQRIPLVLTVLILAACGNNANTIADHGAMKRMKKYLLTAILLAQLIPWNLPAEQPSGPSPSPVTGFLTNTINSHIGKNAFWHLGAVGATALMIATPIDQNIVDTDKNYLGDAFDTGALLVGNVWHILPAAIVYWATDTPEYKYASGAVVQAVGISFLVTTTEKFVFGRAFIDRGDDHAGGNFPLRKSRDAHDFYPFQNIGGLWPSGHTATAFAAASALTAFYKDDPSFREFAVLTYAAAALMGYAMIDGNIHWASDVVAGVLIGHAIGWTVGTDFRSRYGGRNATQGKERPSFIPVIANGSYGFQMRVPY
jgi:membrane-associated phospholipid phosphatase